MIDERVGGKGRERATAARRRSPGPAYQFVPGSGSSRPSSMTASGASSTLIASRVNRSAGNSATSSRSAGSSTPQRRHPVAQKSISTTRPAWADRRSADPSSRLPTISDDCPPDGRVPDAVDQARLRRREGRRDGCERIARLLRRGERLLLHPGAQAGRRLERAPPPRFADAGPRPEAVGGPHQAGRHVVPRPGAHRRIGSVRRPSVRRTRRSPAPSTARSARTSDRRPTAS